MIYGDRPKKRKSCTSSCQGQIAEVIRKDDSVYHGERVTYAISYYPVLEYEVEGKLIRSQLYFGSDKMNTFSKGDHYTVHYNPENPTDFYIVVNRRGTGIGVVCLVLGLCLLLLNGGLF